MTIIRALTADTGKVRAEGRIINFGPPGGDREGRLVGGKDRLLAHATTTSLVMDLPQKA